MKLRNSLVLAFVLALALTASSCSSDSDSDTTRATSGPSAGATTSGKACGVQKVDGVQARTFCGTGTAGITSAASTFILDQAACETADDYVTVNAGTIVLGTTAAAKKGPRGSTQYLGLAVGRVAGTTTGKAASEDGAFTGGTLATNDKGTALVTNPSTLKVTLTDNRTAGSFSAKVVGGGTVKGTFSCS